MAAEQLELFEPIKPVRKKKKQVPKKKQPSKKKAVSKKETAPKKKAAPRFRLAKGEIAYMCPECDDKPTIYTKIIPKLACPTCKMWVEVVDENL